MQDPHIDNYLKELKSNDVSILESIRSVRNQFGLSLLDAQQVVLESHLWQDQKEEFLNNQFVAEQEFLEALTSDPDAGTIHFEKTPTQTNITVVEKTSNSNIGFIQRVFQKLFNRR
jgi:hypothetical protein